MGATRLKKCSKKEKNTEMLSHAKTAYEFSRLHCNDSDRKSRLSPNNGPLLVSFPKIFGDWFRPSEFGNGGSHSVDYFSVWFGHRRPGKEVSPRPSSNFISSGSVTERKDFSEAFRPSTTYFRPSAFCSGWFLPPLAPLVIFRQREPSNSYYIHYSDSPGQVLVSQLLTGENYISWSCAMLIALSVKNKVGFVDGFIPEPQSVDPILLNSWTWNNNMVLSWILNSVSKEIFASIIFTASAREIWLDLWDRFQQRNDQRFFQLKRELMNLHQDKDSVSTYFTKLKTIWEELSNYRPNCSCGTCSCGGVKNLTDFHHMEYIMSFLMGLDDSFSQVRGQLLFMDPMPLINRVFSLVVQEEQQRKTTQASGSHTPTDTMAFTVKFGKTEIHKPSSQSSQRFQSNCSAPQNQN
ncbi:uncharacterized protein [Aristolochia californica]|uniref:uncharacterized protein n=1 Tax=Aristolochia californica TaxID=171875 RepID=UPI0035DF2712